MHNYVDKRFSFGRVHVSPATLPNALSVVPTSQYLTTEDQKQKKMSEEDREDQSKILEDIERGSSVRNVSFVSNKSSSVPKSDVYTKTFTVSQTEQDGRNIDAGSLIKSSTDSCRTPHFGDSLDAPTGQVLPTFQVQRSPVQTENIETYSTHPQGFMKGGNGMQGYTFRNKSTPNMDYSTLVGNMKPLTLEQRLPGLSEMGIDINLVIMALAKVVDSPERVEHIAGRPNTAVSFSSDHKTRSQFTKKNLSSCCC